jgi:hypothetical protein
MVVIRQIIALGCLLASFGCASRLPLQGDWRAERHLEFAHGIDPYAAVTLNRVVLNIKENGDFQLVDLSIPREGKLDLTAKTQTLGFDVIAGRPANRSSESISLDYTINYRDDDTIELKKGSDPSILLHRETKPTAK